MNEPINRSHNLLVTIVKKGMASNIVRASKEAGAEGGTIFYGKGTGIHEVKKFFGISGDSDREVILTLIPQEKVEAIVFAVEKAAKLDEPGTGLGFVVEVKRLAGIAHLLTLQNEAKQGGSNEE
ncbi:P-II family nitrogen regulator [Bacillus solitudinis]|uniref:P-II family nitrogen regulator n=1 Tax=Bacillus solitudinis TaxID=2014074 RepID=UPI001D0D4F55|nr:P-II family nitrogen regulator [Bacillus solitudinis]